MKKESVLASHEANFHCSLEITMVWILCLTSVNITLDQWACLVAMCFGFSGMCYYKQNVWRRNLRATLSPVCGPGQEAGLSPG